MIPLTVTNNISESNIDFKLALLECNVDLSEINEKLWATIAAECQELRKSLKIENISKIPAITTSRKAYKLLGKDPARYRLSAEALMRRILKGNELYQINNVVDIINFSSLKTGFSIGGYDAEKINGPIAFDVGRVDDLYSAIGRGELNIANLPILRDNDGAFGSPTSDSVRTSITMSSKRIHLVFFCFGAFNELENAVKISSDLLITHANATAINTTIIE